MITFLCIVAGMLLASWAARRRRSLTRRQIAAAGAAAVLLAIAAIAAGPTGLVLQKCAGRVLMPIGLVWLGLLLSAVWAFHRRRHHEALVLAAVFLGLTLAGNQPLAECAVASLERRYAQDPFQQEPFDAVCVLGGGISETQSGVIELGPSGDRVALGARLYHHGKARQLVTTGSPIEGFKSPVDSVRATTIVWQDMGVPIDAIVPVSGARTTSEEAALIAALVRERGWKRVGVVTSAWHMRRATRLFQRQGLDITPLAADHRGNPTWNGLHSVIPSGEGAYMLHVASWELLGSMVGR